MQMVLISKTCFNAIAACDGRARIALRSGTSLARAPTSEGLKERNRLVLEIQSHGGKTQWKKQSDYHRRSLVETYMYRFKTILGNKLSSRKFGNQKAEAKIKVSILNRMTQLGMPESFAVTG